ncbi:MAG: cold shock domain-containing protein [Bacteroidetes bacterium]|jgi:cold shock CspA family protein|nr:cold shock domain-containing protein [Bacteroidota bacterium]
MGRAKETFGKKEVRNKQIKKRKDKEKRKAERKEQGKNSFEDMIAWVDENGQITDTQPEPTKDSEIKAENIEVSVPKGGNVKDIETYSGKINNFDESKGFGFITCNQIDKPVFVHVNDSEEPLQTGLKVEFETELGEKGLKAVNVKVK